jgi:hypothetical protein
MQDERCRSKRDVPGTWIVCSQMSRDFGIASMYSYNILQRQQRLGSWEAVAVSHIGTAQCRNGFCAKLELFIALDFLAAFSHLWALHLQKPPQAVPKPPKLLA